MNGIDELTQYAIDQIVKQLQTRVRWAGIVPSDRTDCIVICNHEFDASFEHPVLVERVVCDRSFVAAIGDDYRRYLYGQCDRCGVVYLAQKNVTRLAEVGRC